MCSFLWKLVNRLICPDSQKNGWDRRVSITCVAIEGERRFQHYQKLYLFLKESGIVFPLLSGGLSWLSSQTNLLDNKFLLKRSTKPF